MTRPLLLLLALLLVPGCLQADALAPLARGDEYRLVLVDATYRRATEGASVCGFASLPEIDETNRTIRFHDERPPENARALVLAIAWDQSACGVATAAWATLDEPTGLARLELPGLGTVGVEFREDGSLRVDGQPLTPGGLEIAAQGEAWNATASFRDAGIWPATGIGLA